MNTLENMKTKLCPMLNSNCVGEECIACKNVFTPPEDKKVVSHYKCLNEECGAKINTCSSLFHDTYCVKCGAGRVGDKNAIEAIYIKMRCPQEDKLYICTEYEDVDTTIFDSNQYTLSIPVKE